MRTLDISIGFKGSLAATKTIKAVPDALSNDHSPAVTALW